MSQSDRKTTTKESGSCCAIFEARTARSAICFLEQLKRFLNFLRPSNAVLFGLLGETFSCRGVGRRYIRLIDQNCHQIHVLNKITNYANLKRIYWREIGHFAELRYFWPFGR